MKPSMLVAAELVLGKDKENMLSQNALSNGTVKGRIESMNCLRISKVNFSTK